MTTGSPPLAWGILAYLGYLDEHHRITPLAWGILCDHFVFNVVHGITPTCVGNTVVIYGKLAFI
ncbi:hypothetical protein ACADC178_0811 [Lactobacillus delbrueckii subsp. lactis]|nr:hypothetical protein ACADC178_0811 [Lactobacillus delbrueckii subsp. lactis]